MVSLVTGSGSCGGGGGGKGFEGCSAVKNRICRVGVALSCRDTALLFEVPRGAVAVRLCGSGLFAPVIAVFGRVRVEEEKAGRSLMSWWEAHVESRCRECRNEDSGRRGAGYGTEPQQRQRAWLGTKCLVLYPHERGLITCI